MSTDKLFIPKKCKVGFNKRSDTYSGKLGYVIAWDGKKWRKEPSWLGWIEKHVDSEYLQKAKEKDFNDRKKQLTQSFEGYKDYLVKNPTYQYYIDTVAKGLDAFLATYGVDKLENYNYHNAQKETNDPSIIPIEFDNTPRSGFVLNKKAGGTKWSWNTRNTYCRVWDPMGFEVEISIPNLLFILQESSSFKGKGLEGDFVYAWDGKDLVLLPTSCEDFKSSANFTKLQDGKVSAKELVEGCYYKTKQQEDLMYMGRYATYTDSGHVYASKIKDKDYTKDVKPTKNHVFLNKNGSILTFSGLTHLAQRVTDVADPSYAGKLDKMLKDKMFRAVTKLVMTPINDPKDVKNDLIYKLDKKGVYRSTRVGVAPLYSDWEKRFNGGSTGAGEYILRSQGEAGVVLTGGNLISISDHYSYRGNNEERVKFDVLQSRGFVNLHIEYADGTTKQLGKY
jgi:hypothetical protein